MHKKRLQTIDMFSNGHHVVHVLVTIMYPLILSTKGGEICSKRLERGLGAHKRRGVNHSIIKRKTDYARNNRVITRFRNVVEF